MPVESVTDAIRDGLQDLAYRAAGMAGGDVTFEAVDPVSQFPGYRPVVVPASHLDRRCSETVMNKKTSLQKTPTSQNCLLFLLLLVET